MDPLVAKYRKLLVAEESLSALDETLTLVEATLGAEFIVRAGQIEVTLPRNQSAAKAVESISAMRGLLKLSELEAAAASRRRTAKNRQCESRVLRAAVTLSVAPIIAARIEPELRGAKFSLVQDACLLLFHHVYFALLPELGVGWEVERGSLLESFQVLAGQQWRAADRFHVLALTYDAQNNVELAAKLYREVVAATSSDSHDFMTCLQAAWFYLMEHDRVSEAFEFLVDTMPRVTLADQDEFRGLLKQTFSLAHSIA